jgi:hypothetical protein
VLNAPAVALAASMRAMPDGICSEAARGILGRTGLGGVLGGVSVVRFREVLLPVPAPGLPPVAVQMRVGRLRAKAGETPLHGWKGTERTAGSRHVSSDGYVWGGRVWTHQSSELNWLPCLRLVTRAAGPCCMP